jgi:hypothetical protein
MSDWKVDLKNIYSTPGEGGAFSSVDKLYKILKINHHSVTKNQIKNWLNDNYTYAIHKARQLNFSRNPILASYIDHNWQGDILFFPELTNYNDRKGCILVCIDVISRYAWGKPMRTKSGEETAKSFEEILKESSRKPEKLQTDKGTEFYNKNFKAVLKKYDIKLYSTESDNKAAIAERCIKEIKKLIYRYLTMNQTNRYIDVLQKIFETYNKTFHSSIGMAPIDVNEKTMSTALRNLYGYLWDKDIAPLPTVKKKQIKKKQFQVGDQVRITLGHVKFSKGYKGFWTTEIFTINEIKNYVPFKQFKLKNSKGEILKGLFYEKQIQSASIPSQRYTNVNILKHKIMKGKKWVLVNWENEDPKLKRWILRSQLQ